jgi:5-(carboxyamino)imidazole ribonucleotide synthase
LRRIGAHGMKWPSMIAPNERTRRSGPAVGILGGGQLAKMTAQAAFQLGCEVVVVERSADCPAAPVATDLVVGDWNDPQTLLDVASQVDVVLLENEFVDAEALRAIEERGHRLWPSSASLRLVQDKLVQKETLAAAGLPVPRFDAAPTPESVVEHGGRLGWPLLLKKRRFGYDGKGNATVDSPRDVAAAFDHLASDGGDLYVESFCPFTMELAVILTRSPAGDAVVYPVVETIQREHVCTVVKAPAAIHPEIAARASEVARRAVEAVSGVGTFGVELFLTGDGGIFVNEMAPRVHNSGHYTIEACACSQFENHVRAVLGLPLGSPAMRAPAAVMINLLGESAGPGAPRGLARALDVGGAHVHLYGKSRSARLRKMGHVTALGASLDAAFAIAQRAADAIRFGEERT